MPLLKQPPHKPSDRGFTIVELLIVIVVIGILAAITIVAYNGVTQRARDTQRLSDLETIQKSLEVYKAENGTYPQSDATATAVCATHNNGYSFSDATDGTWMKTLVTSGAVARAPVSPGNNCTSYYSYLYVTAASYNCTGLRTTNYYILQMIGTDGTLAIPNGAVGVGGVWRPCTGATAGWSSNAYLWTFEKDDTPS